MEYYDEACNKREVAPCPFCGCKEGKAPRVDALLDPAWECSRCKARGPKFISRDGGETETEVFLLVLKLWAKRVDEDVHPDRVGDDLDEFGERTMEDDQARIMELVDEHLTAYKVDLPPCDLRMLEPMAYAVAVMLEGLRVGRNIRAELDGDEYRALVKRVGELEDRNAEPDELECKAPKGVRLGRMLARLKEEIEK